jgi:hypothetical protein
MRIHVQLIAETPESSLSVVTVAGEFLCFALEDGYKERKVKGQTRIPPGIYKVGRRKVGGFYEQFRLGFGHDFAIQLLDVPNFQNILVHIGNTVADTAGCLLVGFGAAHNGKFTLSQSTAAYLHFYEVVKLAFDRGDAVEVEISRERLMTATPSV